MGQRKNKHLEFICDGEGKFEVSRLAQCWSTKEAGAGNEIALKDKKGERERQRENERERGKGEREKSEWGRERTERRGKEELEVRMIEDGGKR